MVAANLSANARSPRRSERAAATPNQSRLWSAALDRVYIARSSTGLRIGSSARSTARSNARTVGYSSGPGSRKAGTMDDAVRRYARVPASGNGGAITVPGPSSSAASVGSPPYAGQ